MNRRSFAMQDKFPKSDDLTDVQIISQYPVSVYFVFSYYVTGTIVC